MNLRLIIAVIILFTLSSFPAQAQGIIYLDDQPGKMDFKRNQAIKGFNTAGITQVVSRIPMINQPVGYDVVLHGAAFDEGGKRPVHGQVRIGIPRLYKWQGKLTRQGEYRQVGMLLNELHHLTGESYFLSADTRKAGLPELFSDTVAFRREIRAGQEVWVAANQPDHAYALLMINPRNTPCFIPATKEQLARLWISKLSLEIEKYQRLMAENKTYLAAEKGKPGKEQLVKNLEDGIKTFNLWLEYYSEKKAIYQRKLASLSAAEKKEPAEAGTPVQLAVTVNSGVPVEKVTGDMDDEWVEAMSGGVKKTRRIYLYNPDFFDPKLPRTAIQLMLIRDAFKIGARYNSNNDEKIRVLLNQKFYPELDYKALAGLMYK